MRYQELLDRMRGGVDARLVYSEPYEKDGAIIIAAARVGGGGGGGGAESGAGEGLGFGFGGQPVGAFVLRDGRCEWKPAVDVNAIIQTAGWVLLAGIISIAVVKLRRSHDNSAG
ncbi:sporulation protein [Nocardia panacis]|nr:sporulation protein [Nocardia panacis]